MDSRLKTKMLELKEENVNTTSEMMSRLYFYSRTICPPDVGLENTRFFPSRKIIQNHMIKMGIRPPKRNKSDKPKRRRRTKRSNPYSNQGQEVTEVFVPDGDVNYLSIFTLSWATVSVVVWRSICVLSSCSILKWILEFYNLVNKYKT